MQGAPQFGTSFLRIALLRMSLWHSGKGVIPLKPSKLAAARLANVAAKRPKAARLRKRGFAKPRGGKLTTEYHSKLFAHELTRQHSVADSEKLAGALLDAWERLSYVRPFQANPSDTTITR